VTHDVVVLFSARGIDMVFDRSDCDHKPHQTHPGLLLYQMHGGQHDHAAKAESSQLWKSNISEDILVKRCCR